MNHGGLAFAPEHPWMTGTPDGSRHPRAPPRSRVELWQPGRPGWSAGFADAVDGCWVVEAAEATRLAAAGEGGRIEVVDQETEAVVAEHSVR